jgi:hypothetical protein
MNEIEEGTTTGDPITEAPALRALQGIGLRLDGRPVDLMDPVQVGHAVLVLALANTRASARIDGKGNLRAWIPTRDGRDIYVEGWTTERKVV